MSSRFQFPTRLEIKFIIHAGQGARLIANTAVGGMAAKRLIALWGV
jgi:hypothetical protein